MDLNIKNDLIDDEDLINMKSVSFEESKRTNNCDYSNMSLNELIISLKEKLKLYESHINEVDKTGNFLNKNFVNIVVKGNIKIVYV